MESEKRSRILLKRLSQIGIVITALMLGPIILEFGISEKLKQNASSDYAHQVFLKETAPFRIGRYKSGEVPAGHNIAQIEAHFRHDIAIPINMAPTESLKQEVKELIPNVEARIEKRNWFLPSLLKTIKRKVFGS